jgi:oligopeptide/dipeptide ABC transporter ATP-binding protein
MAPTPLLEIRNATKVYGGGFLQSTPPLVALEDFNLTIYDSPATITTIAGESGSGKTTLANAVLGFLSLTSGQILYKGKDITKLNHEEAMDYRREVQAVFQDPYEVYNPFYRVKHIFDMVVDRFHMARSRQEAREVIEEALKVVGLRGEEVLEKYPHQLSGGQRQRIMAARAFLLKPRIIVADEPVSMIDASLQVRILDIFRNLKEAYGISFLYITHDLSTAYQISDDIYILYNGSVMESGSVDAVIQNPQHPYTQLLVSAITVPDPTIRWEGRSSSSASEIVETAQHGGCKFYARCPHAMPRCASSPPPVVRVGEQQYAACYLYSNSHEPAAAHG